MDPRLYFEPASPAQERILAPCTEMLVGLSAYTREPGRNIATGPYARTSCGMDSLPQDPGFFTGHQEGEAISRLPSI